MLTLTRSGVARADRAHPLGRVGNRPPLIGSMGGAVSAGERAADEVTKWLANEKTTIETYAELGV